MKQWIAAINLMVACTVANFLWAWIGDWSFASAFERSYFQAAALLLMAWHLEATKEPPC